MLDLYHAGVSTCSQKVRLVLAEKNLDFTPHDVDLISGAQHDPDYIKLNPNHVVPTLVDEGRVLIESTLINEYLDEAYPDPPMKPTDAMGRHAVRLWTKKIDSFHSQVGIITFAIGPRTLLLKQPAEVREANIDAIPDPTRRAQRRSVIELGVKAPEFAGALAALLAILSDMGAALDKQPWLSGEEFGLADAAALPYVLRADHLAMTPFISAHPSVSDWLARVRARPSYATAVEAWLPEPLVAMFRGNGEAVWADVQATASAT
jgi:glutathione S-transferase